MPSNLRVEVAFERPAEFAGENFSAIITFRNVASLHARSESKSENSSASPISHSRRLSMQLASTFKGLYGGSSSNSSNGGSPLSHESTRSLNINSSIGRSSSFSLSQKQQSESLFMGYVQLQGFFQVDDTLIDVGAFQHAKTRGIIVGRKGIEYSSSDGSPFIGGVKSSSGNNNINSSGGTGGGGAGTSGGSAATSNPRSTDNGILKNIGNFLFSTEGGTRQQHPGPLSEDIPIFSSPQTLLFVDLKLEPGQSKSFSYQFPLPEELPPSCRGRSINIIYNMVIGTQKLSSRPGGPPASRIILIPFRIFPFVDSDGSQPSHDLVNPIVLTKADDAKVMELEGRRASLKSFEALSEYRKQQESKIKSEEQISQEKQDFQHYVESLLDSSSNAAAANHVPSAPMSKRNSFDPFVALHLLRRRSSTQLLKQQLQAEQSEQGQPKEEASSSSTRQIPQYSVRDNIHYFVKYFSQLGPLTISDDSSSTNNNNNNPPPSSFKTSFDIVRGNKRITTINLSRPVYRVGDEILASLDMSKADIPCYHVTATLETSEKISDDGIRLSSESETLSATRRIYSHYMTSSFSSKMTHIQLTIPSTATPQFKTSSISLNWSIKLDFITDAAAATATAPPESLINSNPQFSSEDKSLEIFTSRPVLCCEGFSCRIPLQVYPTDQDISALLDYQVTPHHRQWII